ncbi:hypothetical protein FGRMN_6854 [Fusarium graminum]|nr:hypothetical protein FGRMN_6854 [Fusarium graminum]
MDYLRIFPITLANMSVIGAYRSDVFNSILGLGPSHRTFHAQNGVALVDSPLQALFVKHGMTETFGVCLVHRHFPIKPDQILVETNGTATAWQLPQAHSSGQDPSLCYKKYGGLIKPLSWTVDDDGTFRPYEFFLERDTADCLTSSVPNTAFQDFLSNNQQFFVEFRQCLDSHNLRGILGLRLIREGESQILTLEVTEEFANITFPLPPHLKLSELDRMGGLEATWVYPAPDTDQGLANNPEAQLGTKLKSQTFDM